MRLAGINRSLKEGCRLHAFLSGGGLRVVRIEKNNKLKGYGEHPHVESALSHANEDFIAGGRPYSEVYGVTKPHYLTGSSTPTSPLDSWLRQAHTFDAWQSGDDVVFQLKRMTRRFYYVTKTGRGKNLWAAMEKAFRTRMVPV